MALSVKHQAFVNAYLKCWNASEAARIAGYNGRSNQIGYRLLMDVDIKAEIEQRVSDLAMSANEVLVRLGEQARIDVGDFAGYYKEANEFDLKQAKEDGKSHLIKKLKPTQYGIELELHDKDFAIDRIGKIHKMFGGDVGSEDTPFVIKVLYGQRTNSQSETTSQQTD